MNVAADPLSDQLPTRKTLVRNLENLSDQESWREFFDTYWRLIYNFALKSGCTESEAEEVVQETIISVSRKMPEFKYDPAVCSFRGWLMHVANWRVIDQIRKRNHNLVSIHADDAGTNAGPLAHMQDPNTAATEQLWDKEWKDNLLSVALDRIKRQCNPEHFQIYYLLVIKNRSVREVADTLKVTHTSVYVIKHRLAALIKREVKRLEQQLLVP